MIFTSIVQDNSMNKITIWKFGFLALICTAIAVLFLFGNLAMNRSVRCDAVEREALSIDVDEEHFPDDVFRGWILDPANLNGAGSDGVLTAEELEGITEIQRRGSSDSMISDLTGIEYFTALQSLNVPYNSLTSLDLRANTELMYVNCSYNRLTDLKVSGLAKIRALWCEFNYLPSLDLSGIDALETIYCRHNLLTAIDFSQNTNLIFIETFDNLLTEIDVSMLKNLEFLHIDLNRLTRLDMSGNLNLKGGGFVVRNNDMRELILPSIPGFTVFYDDFAEQDPITGYDTVEWFSDDGYTQPVTGDVEAQGQTLYARRVVNDYSIVFSANGGSDAPATIAAKYDQTVSLPEQEPTRRGYTFKGWREDIYGDSTVYTAGQEVKNLAGKTQGEKITLYAQWEANKYSVRFEKGADDASGSMEALQTQYGKSTPLPENGFTRTDYDFVGWSLTQDGEVYLSDRQSVYNLTDEDGGEIVLYAVWERSAEFIRRPYKQQLDEAFAGFSEEQYFAEDWDSLVSVYQSADRKLISAGKSELTMERVLSNGKEEMKAIKDEAARVEEVREGWNNEFSEVLQAINAPPIAFGQGERMYNAAKSGLEKSLPQMLESYSILTNEDSRAQAAYQAGQLIQEQTAKLNEFIVAGEWLVRADKYASAALRDVRSALLSEYQSVLRDYALLSEEDQSYISKDVLEALGERLRISEAKANAVAALNEQFEQYSEQDYSPAQWEKLSQVLAANIAAAESADNEAVLNKIIVDNSEQMDNVPTKEEEAAQNPDGPSDGDGDSSDGEILPPDGGTNPPSEPSEPSPSKKGVWIAVSIGAAVVVIAAIVVAVLVIRKKRR